VVIVRHGETEWSSEGRHTGRTDVALNEAGREQARQLRKVLQRRRFAAVYSSPLQRAVETARLAGFDADVIVDPDLQEWDYGEYDGLTSAEVRARRPGWVLWRDGCIGGESLEHVTARADRMIERFRSCDGDVLAFAHGHVLRILTARWLDLHAGAGQRFMLSPASPSTLGYEHDWTALRAWNLPRAQ
jgi:broad specificity phosphatase PhoE